MWSSAFCVECHFMMFFTRNTAILTKINENTTNNYYILTKTGGGKMN